MVEQLGDLPDGVIGFRVSGTITRDEYHQLLDPVLAALEHGETVSLLTVAEDDFHGLDLPALREDLKAAAAVGLKHRKSWRRLAVVTNKDWMRHAMAGFGWLYPGEMRVFDLDQLETAKTWIAQASAEIAPQ